MSHSRHTKTITAIDDKGNSYSINEFTHYLDDGSPNGMKTLQTDDGGDVTFLGGGRFQIRITSTINPFFVQTNDPEFQ